MLKRFICGAFMVAALCGSATFPAQADELYIRNRAFKDAYFLGDTAYVPVDGFLKAVRVPWSQNGSVIVVGEGGSPDLEGLGESITLMNAGKRHEIVGLVKDGRLYVPTKTIAKAVGYTVIVNNDTGVVDVIQSRLTNDSDEKAAQEIASAKAAAKKERDEAWQQRVAKAKELRKAKEEAKKKADGDDDADSDDEDDDLDAKGQKDDVADKDTSKDMNMKDKSKDEKTKDKSKDMDTKDTSTDADMADNSQKEEPETEKKPPPKANLEVLSTQADPNNYTGEVQIRATVQNQGYAAAKNVRASLSVVGPDGLTWINKTIYRGPMNPDERWEITEDYKHRAGAAIPRGDYKITVTPQFDSVPPKE